MIGYVELVFGFNFLSQLLYQATCIRKKPMTVLAVKKMDVWFAKSVIKSNSPVFFAIQGKSLDIIISFQVLQSPVYGGKVYFSLQFVIDFTGSDWYRSAVHNLKNTMPAFG
jgi:hypothetical protein